MHGVGHGDVVDVLVRNPPILAAPEDTSVDEGGDELLDEEGVALGALRDEGSEPVGQRCGHQPVEHRLRILRPERIEPDETRVPPTAARSGRRSRSSGRVVAMTISAPDTSRCIRSSRSRSSSSAQWRSSRRPAAASGSAPARRAAQEPARACPSPRRREAHRARTHRELRPPSVRRRASRRATPPARAGQRR